MRALSILAFAALIAAAAAIPVEKIESYTFDAFVEEHGRTYARGTEEYERRREIFETKKKAVLKHNACPKAGKNFKKTINQFSDYTDAEFQVRNGARIRENWDARAKLRKSANFKQFRSTGAPVPQSVDWRLRSPSIFTGIKDQGDCGSCWAHASTENLESHWALRTGQLFTLSQQQITACAPNPNDCGGVGGCGGSIAELAYAYVSQVGIAQEWTYPYTAYSGTTGTCNANFKKTIVNISGYTAVQSNDQDAVMEAIAFYGPLAINVDASMWSDYGGGIYDGCNFANNITIDHVVQLVGYGYDDGLKQSYWIVRNSWSPAWGENGFIRLIRHEKPQCGWDVQPQQGTGCNGGPPQLWACGQCGLLFDTVFPNVRS